MYTNSTDRVKCLSCTLCLKKLHLFAFSKQGYILSMATTVHAEKIHLRKAIAKIYMQFFV